MSKMSYTGLKNTEDYEQWYQIALFDSAKRMGASEEYLKKNFPKAHGYYKKKQDEAYNERSYLGKIADKLFDKLFGKKNIVNNSKNETRSESEPRSESELIKAEIEYLERDIKHNHPGEDLKDLKDFKEVMIKGLKKKLTNSKEIQNPDKIKYSKNSRQINDLPSKNSKQINDLSIEITESNLRIAGAGHGFWNDILIIFEKAYQSSIQKKISQLQKEDSIEPSLSSVKEKYLEEKTNKNGGPMGGDGNTFVYSLGKENKEYAIITHIGDPTKQVGKIEFYYGKPKTNPLPTNTPTNRGIRGKGISGGKG